MTLHDLQQERKVFDEQFWQNKENIDVWTRHVLLHIGKMVGKLSNYVEQREHKVKVSDEVIRAEVIPDLLGYSLQLGNLFDVNVEQAYQERLNKVAEKMKTQYRQE